jgi:hypothetical protein
MFAVEVLFEEKHGWGWVEDKIVVTTRPGALTYAHAQTHIHTHRNAREDISFIQGWPDVWFLSMLFALWFEIFSAGSDTRELANYL